LHPTRCISVCFSRLCQCSSSFSLCVRQLSSSTYCSTILTTLHAILSRTYRHGTPARLPARSTTAPKTPGSRETPTNPIQGSGSGPVGGGRNSRAVSPSPIGSRISREGLSSNKTINNNSNNNTSSSTLRNQSPGTRGLIGRDFSNTTRTRGSFEVESLGDNMSTGYSISDASHDSHILRVSLEGVHLYVTPDPKALGRERGRHHRWLVFTQAQAVSLRGVPRPPVAAGSSDRFNICYKVQRCGGRSVFTS
jgi:hypothetical protein